MGVGKSTAAKMISEAFGFELLEERFGENAFLPRFYKDMPRWAFHSQTFFLMEKITQLLEAKKLLETTSVVQDTPIQQDAFSYAQALHAQGNMDDAEWKLYQKIYHAFEPQFPVPDLIISLEASVPVIMQRINARGRNYEQKIPQKYVQLLDTLNHAWVKEYTDVSFFPVQTDTLNIVKSKKARNEFMQLVAQALLHQ